jgi:hypothetical protein
LSRDSDRGNCTIANTLNSTNITGHSFSSVMRKQCLLPVK